MTLPIGTATGSPRSGRRAVLAVALLYLVGGLAAPATASPVPAPAASAAHPAFAAGPEGPPVGSAAAVEGASLTGKVLTLNGVPLIGAFVALVAKGSEQPAAITVTDGNGRFAVADLPAGPYSLVAQNLGFVSAVVQGLQLPRSEPVAVQLRPRPAVPLFDADAELDLGWAFRSGVRDVLRQESGTSMPGGGNPVGGEVDDAGATRVARGGGVTGDLFGELQVWNLATAMDSRGTVGGTSFALASSDRDRADGWAVQAHLDDAGAVVARSDLRERLGRAHTVRMGLSYAGSHLRLAGDGTGEQHGGWIGTAYAEDSWRIAEPFTLTYGAEYEHYDFLDETLLLSPRVALAFVPNDETRITGGFAYAAHAPGLRDMSFEFDPLDARYVDLVSSDDLEPERVKHFEFGVERRVGDTSFRVRAYYDEVNDELLGLYLQSPEGHNDYLVFNMEDADVQGVELGMTRDFGEWLVGKLEYDYGVRDGAAVPVERLVRRSAAAGAGTESEDSTVDITHQVRAALKAILGDLDTQLLAVYHWQRGVPVLKDEEMGRQYGRLDVRVRQPLPIRALNTKWAALVQVRNLLGHEYRGILDLALNDLPFLSRLVSGGVAVRF